jgi:CHAT domain-containing protein/Tfp pilus assembly protein PilF
MRGAERKTFDIALGARWESRVRALVPGAAGERFAQGAARLAAGKTEEAASIWLALAEELKQEKRTELAVWLRFYLAERLIERRDTVRATALLHEALADVRADDLVTRAVIWRWIGSAGMRAGDFAAAARGFEEAARLQEGRPEMVIGYASSLYDLASALSFQGDFLGARERFLKTVAIEAPLIPGSSLYALALFDLGRVEMRLERLADSDGHLSAAAAIQERNEPDSVALGRTLGTHGWVLCQLGRLEEARATLERANGMLKAVAPKSQEAGLATSNLGFVALHQGDLDGAERYYGENEALLREIAPGTRNYATALLSLASLARDRGYIELAEERNLASLEVWSKLGPESADVGNALFNLGVVARERGDLDLAQGRFERVRAILEKVGLGGPSLAAVYQDLGDLAARTGDLATAKQHYESALAIRASRAGGTAEEARDLAGLAGVLRRMGEPDRAIEVYQRALETLDRQAGRLGGGRGVRGTFLALRQAELRGFVDLLVERREPAPAFAVLERFLARGFLDLLADRDLALPATLPAPLRERRVKAEAELDRLQAEAAELDPSRDKDQERLRALRSRLREVQAELEATVGEIRKSSPEYAALRHPQPIDAAAAARALPSGTFLLSFCVGPERTLLFVLAKGGGPQVYTLKVGEAELRAQVQRFRQLVQAALPGGALGAERLASLQAQGQELYAAFLAPAEASLASASRLVIVPDGPLHTLPWGALVRPGRGRSRPLYLVEWKAFRLVPSATAGHELEVRAAAPRASGDGRLDLAVFADPSFPERLRAARQVEEGSPLRGPVERGLTFDPLPASRDEARRIAALFPARASRFEGAEALEATAKRVAPSARYLHFATHVTLDTALPFNSAVVLSIPERFEARSENGLLQAWEILDSARLSADLVVLSGCESGLGRELGGEGLLGLTQAFLHAGARSVAASLWRVSDRATAELMVRLYRHLQHGESRAEALRAAQVELIRREGTGEDYTYPFFWSAFQLYGAGD